MKVTNKGIKYRQPTNASDEVLADYPQTVSAEQKGNVGVYAPSRITENNIINANLSAEGWLEKILDRNNLNTAFKKVKSNKGAGGIDGMGVDNLLPYLKENQKNLIQLIRDGKYRPNPVRRVEIPKEESLELCFKVRPRRYIKYYYETEHRNGKLYGV